ncbi:MAG: hypothetical protein EOO24_63015 [Comamonadaceae bacterium]|nr:MAG: hypothetical protein EOO24_63015 [Comamonadaceae bacterium]
MPGWVPFRGPAPREADDSLAAVMETPSPSRAKALDPLRSAFWQAFRHLFPPHAQAAQTRNGSIVISWSVEDEPHAPHPYAAPVMLRFDAQLVDAMQQAEPHRRIAIAGGHEPTLREGLRGYDPFARFQSARVVVIG